MPSTALSVYPNPNNGYFTINYSSSTNENYQLQVIDIMDRLVYESKRSASTGDNVMHVDLSAAPKGIYLLRMKTESESFEMRMVVE